MPEKRGAWRHRAWIWIGLSLIALAGASDLAATGPAGAEVAYVTSPVDIALPVLTLAFRERVAPRKLSGSTPTPIALSLSGRIGTVDGSHPPAVEQIALDLDRHIAIDLHGVAVCHPGRPESLLLEESCKNAIVGRGKVTVQLQFPEQKAISTESELIVFNRGGQGAGTAALYAVAVITQPTPAALVMTIALTKRHGQDRVTVGVPKIAGGAGSLTELDVKLKKRFRRNGRWSTFSPAAAQMEHSNRGSVHYSQMARL